MKKAIHKTQDKILAFFVSKKKRKQNSEFKPKGIGSAESIAVLFELSDESELIEAKKIHKELKKNIAKVRMLGYYYKEKNKPEFASFLDFDFINNKEFNLKGRILSGHINTFCEKKFDVLINLCDEQNIRMHIVALNSQANFKAGFASKKTDFIYQLIVSEASAENISEKFEKLYPILKMINPDIKHEKI